MANKDLKLNSLARYSKQSPRLILEEHGHCEVPAGCGGVVLRWRNPDRAIPCEMWLYTSAETVDFYLDGEHPSSSRPLLNYGDHVIALRISEFAPNRGVLMFATIYNEEDMIHTRLSRPTGREIRILSLPDRSWKYCAVEPSDDSWKHYDFDDSTWLPMISKSFREPDEKDRNWYRFRKLREFGAKGLGISNKAEVIWIRKAFSIHRSSS